VERFEHEQKIRQPGEPVHSMFEFNNPYDEQPVMFLITLTEDQNSDNSVEGIKVEINNYISMEIPVKMQASQVLKLDAKGNLQLFDKNWNLMETLNGGKIPVMAKGRNRIMIDARITNVSTSKLKIEVKTMGKAELTGLNGN